MKTIDHLFATATPQELLALIEQYGQFLQTDTALDFTAFYQDEYPNLPRAAAVNAESAHSHFLQVVADMPPADLLEIIDLYGDHVATNPYLTFAEFYQTVYPILSEEQQTDQKAENISQLINRWNDKASQAHDECLGEITQIAYDEEHDPIEEENLVSDYEKLSRIWIALHQGGLDAPAFVQKVKTIILL